MWDGVALSYLFGKLCDFAIENIQNELELTLEEEQIKAFDEILKGIEEIDPIFKNKDFFISYLKEKGSIYDIKNFLEELHPLMDDEVLLQKEKKVLNIINKTIIKYPNLSKLVSLELNSKNLDSKYTGIQQIFSYENFVKNYSENSLTTPIDTDFICDKKNEYIEALSQNEIILFSGKAGEGKTKNAIEIGKEFSFIENRKFRIIYDKKLNIDNELTEKLKNEKIKNLILIDDANRSLEIIEKIKIRYASRIKSGNIKILLTVRDYSKEIILEEIKDFRFYEIKIVEPIEKNIEKVLEEYYGIVNPYYLRKIICLSKLNFRLAMMIGKICINDKNFEFLRTVGQVYDKYFTTIKKDLNLFSDEKVLRLLLPIIIYGSVNIKENSIDQFYRDNLDIDLLDFKKIMLDLEKKEIIDMYEDIVIKISDQVLSTYLFYNILYIKKILSMKDFIELFLLKNSEFTKDALYSMINTFHNDEVIEYLRNELKKYLRENKVKKDELYKIYKYLYFLVSDEILDELCEYILPEKFELDILKEKYVLTFLELIRYDKNIKDILELYFSYLERNPLRVEEIEKSLKENFFYNKESELYQYIYEKDIINALIEIEKMKNKKEVTDMVTNLLLKFLEIENQFTSTNPLNRNSIIFIRQQIVESDNIRKIRNSIFKYLSEIFFKEKEFVMKSLYKYTNYMRRCKDINVLKNDKKLIEEIFDKNFIKKSFEEKILISRYYSFLDDMNIKYNNKILDKILDTEIIFYNNLALHNKNNKFDNFLSKKNFKSELKILIKIIKCVSKIKDRDYYFNFSYLNDLESYLIEKNDKISYSYLINELFNDSDYIFRFNINSMVEMLGEDEVYCMIKQKKNNLKYNYLYLYNCYLSKVNILQVKIDEVLEVYKNGDFEELDYNFEIHKNLKIEYPALLVDTLRILNDRNDKEGLFINYLGIFNSYIWKAKEVVDIFKNDIELLEEIYRKFGSQDYNLLFLYEILEIDFNFLDYFTKDIFLKSSSHLDYSKIKILPNYLNIFKKIINVILDEEDPRYYYLKDVSRLFTGSEEEKIFFRKKIIQNISNKNELEKIFIIISEMKEEEKIEYFLILTANNIAIEIIKDINLYPSLEVGIGSRIPIYNRKIKFYRDISNKLNDLSKRKYKRIVEERIKELEEEREYTKVKEIMREY